MRLHAELVLRNSSAAKSLMEGLEETLTLQRLGVYKELGISLKTTNLIESMMARALATGHIEKMDETSRGVAA